MEDRDYKQRTPLQVAAELGRVINWIKIAKFLYISIILLNCYCSSTNNYCQYLIVSSLVQKC